MSRVTNEKITEILDRCKGRFGWVQIHIDTEENYLLMPLTDLVELLEKQIPKKPVNYDSVPHSRCPVCNNAVKVFEDAHEHHYCLYCGQALDWRDEDEA